MTTPASEAHPRGPRLVLRSVDGVKFRTLGTREARLAFWINTHNAVVADGIVPLGLRHTVWEVPAFFERIYCRVGDNNRDNPHESRLGQSPYGAEPVGPDLRPIPSDGVVAHRRRMRAVARLTAKATTERE